MPKQLADQQQAIARARAYRREAVPQIMDARPGLTRAATEPDLARQAPEI